MSKFLNLLAPALGGTALVAGIAYGVAMRDYGEQKIAALEARLGSTQTAIAAAQAEAEAAKAQVAELQKALAAAESKARAAAAAGGGAPVMGEPAPVLAKKLGLGREAHPAEIAAWDQDVMPDARGLPEGSGDVATGEELFIENCAVCHGEFAEGAGRWPVLAGGIGSLREEHPVKTVGSYWPYLSTAWNYIHRSMPFGNAQSLSADDTYAILAYILYSNDLVDEDFVLSKDNFLSVEMPNADGFIVDDRAEVEYPKFRREPCMENCKDKVEITMHASVLDVTPDDGRPKPAASTQVAAAEQPEAPAASGEAAPAAASVDPELAKKGEKVFKKCKACHQVGEGAKNRTGPVLNGVVGAPVGHAEGFRYSPAMREAKAAGKVWTPENLDAFLTNPKGYLPGTKMGFAGLKKDADRAAVIEYLKTFAN